MRKYEYIDAQKSDPFLTNSVVKMCLWLGVSTSGFNHWVSRPESATVARRQTLIARILHYFENSDGTYGYRRIHADLVEENTECSPELVRQYLPRRSDIRTRSLEELTAIAEELNGRPRKALDWDTPTERMAALLGTR